MTFKRVIPGQGNPITLGGSMAKRSIENFKSLEKYETLTPEVKNRLGQDKKRLQKELAFVEKLLEKPTITKEAAVRKKRKDL